jgi:hypothetical protein
VCEKKICGYLRVNFFLSINFQLLYRSDVRSCWLLGMFKVIKKRKISTIIIRSLRQPDGWWWGGVMRDAEDQSSLHIARMIII